jgi:outer membrane immunogenic protein
VCPPGNSFLNKTSYSFFKIPGIDATWPDSNIQIAEGFKMKKLAIALTALAAFTGSAMAADLAPRPYVKAPPPVMLPSWTGFYIFGGGGGGIWDANDYTKITATGFPLSINQKQGGDGWFGTVGLGYDWQFNGNWVFGLLADGQFGSLKGNITDQPFFLTGNEKMQDAWAAGARLGYLVAPNVLSYVNGGYSGSHWSGTTMMNQFSGALVGVHTNSFNVNGAFVGGGFENSLNIFGISSPGWFMKTEYRAAYYGNKNITEFFDGTNLPIGHDIAFKPFVQTISTSLVYRFNWTGPVVAKY